MSVPDEAIERFLATGELARGYPGWPGSAAQRRLVAESTVRAVLARIVAWRARRAPIRLGPAPSDPAPVVHARIEPMIRGLFPRKDADQLLRTLPGCVRVLTPTTFPTLIADLPPTIAWDLANLLLDAIGAPPLADDTPELDGLCRGVACYVLPDAFRPGPTEDVLVHELAHVLHQAKRGDLGLAPSHAPLLRLAAHDHETFAWACELWSALSRDPDQLHERLAAWEAGPQPADARVDAARLHATLRAAADGDGWSAIGRLVIV